MTTISVAMATYNGAKYIREQLNSLSEQSFLPKDLVVCDDQSTDSTLEIINAFSRSSPFNVTVVRNEERLGYRANFMKAAGLCTSDLIAFCDQDDIWDRDKLATLAAAFEQTGSDLVFHNYRLIDGEGNPLPVSGTDNLPRLGEIDQWTVILGLTQIFRRELLRFSDLWDQSVDQNELDERLAHDQWFGFLAYSLDSLSRVDIPLLSYRQHGNNLYGFRQAEYDFSGAKGNFTALIRALTGRMDVARKKRHLIQDALSRRSRPSLARMRILNAISQRELLPSLQSQIDYYRQTFVSCSARLSIYSEPDILTRLTSFASAFSSGAYRIKRKNAVLDIIYGILIKPPVP